MAKRVNLNLKKPLPPSAPKLTLAQEAEAEAFESADAEEPKAKTQQASSSALRRQESGARISVYIPPEMEEALRMRCARERRSKSDAVTAAIGQWLES